MTWSDLRAKHLIVMLDSYMYYDIFLLLVTVKITVILIISHERSHWNSVQPHDRLYEYSLAHGSNVYLEIALTLLGSLIRMYLPSACFKHMSVSMRTMPQPLAIETFS